MIKSILLTIVICFFANNLLQAQDDEPYVLWSTNQFSGGKFSPDSQFIFGCKVFYIILIRCYTGEISRTYSYHT